MFHPQGTFRFIWSNSNGNLESEVPDYGDMLYPQRTLGFIWWNSRKDVNVGSEVKN